jgi:hypothetical protein
MPSFPTSDHYRLRRAASDPWAIAVALLTGAAAAIFGEPAGIVIGAAIGVILVRVLAEYVVPRTASLVGEDSAAAEAEAVRESLRRLGDRLTTRVPPEVIARVDAIRRLILGLLERESAPAAGSRDLFTLLRTATDYLPTALDAYLRLPGEYATTRRLADGRTPAEVLLSQLELLEREMIEVADAVNRNDVDRLLAHGRFLADRFGRSELRLEGPPASSR